MKVLQTGRGYSEAASLNFTSAYFVATDIGCLLAGFVSLWLARKYGTSAHDARRWVYGGGCCLTSLSVLLPWLGQGWALLAVLLCIGAGALALFPCYYSFVQEISSTHVGRLTGLLSRWTRRHRADRARRPSPRPRHASSRRARPWYRTRRDRSAGRRRCGVQRG